MLARSFKTAADLGIPEEWLRSLVATLYLMESGQLRLERHFDARGPNLFNMAYVGRPSAHSHCGTPGCIKGWAGIKGTTKFHEELDRLFFPSYGDVIRGAGCRFLEDVAPDKAARVLRGYLETGKTDWSR